jgi:hypothetical protein
MDNYCGFTKENWSKFSLAEQMGNIGSEFERAWRWHEKKDAVLEQKAFDRTLALIDLTLADERFRRRLKEIARTREVLCDFFQGGINFTVSDEELRRYFFQFALAARLEK